MIPARASYGEDPCVTEHEWIATVLGSLLGIVAGGRRISFRALHVWEFRDRLVSRENVWLDSGGTAAQLTAPVVAQTLAPQRRHHGEPGPRPWSGSRTRQEEGVMVGSGGSRGAAERAPEIPGTTTGVGRAGPVADARRTVT